MKRIVFIVILAAICVAVKSVLIKPPSTVSISNVQNVPCLGGTYQAVMAYRGGRVEQIVLTDNSRTVNFALVEDGTRYKVTYGVVGFAGESGIREATLSSAVCVLDPDRGVRGVNYSGSLEDLETKIRKRENLNITFAY